MIDSELLHRVGIQPPAIAEFNNSQPNYTLVASPGAGKRIIVRAFMFSSKNDDAEWVLKSDGTEALHNVLFFSPRAGVIGDMTYLPCDVNEALTITTDCNGRHGITVFYNISQ